MPWSIHERNGKFCVVKDSDGSTVHCHETREKALAQQRALYANEPSVSASLELDTDALFQEFMVQDAPQRIEIGPPAPPPVRIEVESASADLLKALTASTEALTERLLVAEEKMAQNQELLVQVLERISENAKQDRETLLASISAVVAGIPEPVQPPEPVVNVTVPEPVVNVSPPQVHVTVESPETKRKMVVERDPLTGLIASAEVTEI